MMTTIECMNLSTWSTSCTQHSVYGVEPTDLSEACDINEGYGKAEAQVAIKGEDVKRTRVSNPSDFLQQHYYSHS
jgi:hypothetical protein